MARDSRCGCELSRQALKILPKKIAVPELFPFDLTVGEMSELINTPTDEVKALALIAWKGFVRNAPSWKGAPTPTLEDGTAVWFGKVDVVWWHLLTEHGITNFKTGRKRRPPKSKSTPTEEDLFLLEVAGIAWTDEPEESSAVNSGKGGA